MRLNQDVLGGQEAWERASIVSGFTSTYFGGLQKVDIKASLSSLPAPKNVKSLELMREEHIRMLEADIEMAESELRVRDAIEESKVDQEQLIQRGEEVKTREQAEELEKVS